MGMQEYIVIGLLLAIMHALAAMKSTEPSSDPEYLKYMPHLPSKLQSSIFFPSGKVWQPGLDTLVTALVAGAPLVIHVKPTLHKSLTQPSAYQLLYKCSANQEKFLTTPLVSRNASEPATYCQQTRPFQLDSQPGKDDMYNISLTRDNNIDFDQAMTHFLEFRVLVSFLNGDVTSGSLFVYNLDALAKPNSAPTAAYNGTFRKYFLTDSAINFLATLSAEQSDHVVPFLSTNFTTVLNKAPIITHSTFSVSLMIHSNKRCTDSFDLRGKNIVVSSGDADQDIMEYVASHPIGYIEPRKGILVYSASLLDTMKYVLAATAKPISVCLRLTLNHPIWDYKLILTISEDVNFRNFLYHSQNHSGGCEIADAHLYPLDRRQLNLTLVEGTQSVVLINPIICNNDENSVPRIFYNDKICLNVNIPLGKEVSDVIWVECNDRYSMSNTGTVVYLEGPITTLYSGQYKFRLHSQVFTYIVTVLSLPRFNTTLHTGALPYATFANINTPVSLNCTVYYDGLNQVTLRPLFRVYELVKRSKWKENTFDEFASKILKRTPHSIHKTVTDLSHRDHHSTLFVELPTVEYKWRNWILIYICIASVSKHDQKFIGLPYYTQTSTDVVYFGAGLKSLHFGSGGTSGVSIAVRAVLASSIVASGVAKLIV